MRSVKGSLMIKGFFKVKRSDGKVALKLTGYFDVENIHWINQALINRQFFRSRCIELDMSEAENITARSMDMLLNALNTLRERGVSVKVTGSGKVPLYWRLSCLRIELSIKRGSVF